MADHVAVIEGKNSGLQLSDNSYNNLRALVEKVFPGLGVLYTALAVLWGWGHVNEVVGTFAALTVFGGILLSLARKGYAPPVVLNDANYDGQVVSDVIDGQTALRLELKPEATENLLNKPNLLIKGVTTE